MKREEAERKAREEGPSTSELETADRWRFISEERRAREEEEERQRQEKERIEREEAARKKANPASFSDTKLTIQDILCLVGFARC